MEDITSDIETVVILNDKEIVGIICTNYCTSSESDAEEEPILMSQIIAMDIIRRHVAL